MTTKGTDNRFRSLTVVGEPGTPATPASGDFKLYVADDGTFYVMDDTGTPTAIGGGGLSDPMTTRGDIIVRNASNTTARLAKGAANTVLTSDGTDVAYALPGIVQLAQTVLGSDTPNITFASISGSYSSLMIVGTARTDRANVTDYLAVQFNADTGNNYDQAQWDATGNNPATGGTSANAGQVAGASATTGFAGGFRILLPDYARTTFHKTMLSESVNPTGVVSTKFAGKWANTAAITQVLIKPLVGSNFKTGTVMTLYGMK